MASGEILIKWVSESAGAIRDMNRMNRAFGDTETKFQKASRVINRAGTIAAAGLAAMVPIATDLIKSASDQEQAFGALDAVFKDYADAVKDAAGAAADFGLSKTEYAEFATVIGAQLQNLGLDLGEATTQTQDLISMAGDMAAQFGGSTAEAVQALSSALRGERDPIERYAVSLNEASIKAKMAEDNLSPIEATLALINEQLGKSGTIGAAAREYDTFASATGRLSAKWDNLKASIFGSEDGKSTGAAADMIDELSDALEGISDWIEENPDDFNKIAIGITGVAVALVSLKIALSAIVLLRDFIRVVNRVKGLPFLAIGLAIDALKDQFDEFDFSIGGVVRGLKDLLTLDLGEIENWTVTKWLDRAIEWVKRKAAELDRWTKDFIPDWLLRLFGFDPNTGIGRSPRTPNTPPSNNRPDNTPVLLSTQIGRISQPAPARTGGNISVFVDGQSRPARIRQEPVWQPHVTLGVI